MSLNLLVLGSWFKINLELLSEQVRKAKPAKVQVYEDDQDYFEFKLRTRGWVDFTQLPLAVPAACSSFVSLGPGSRMYCLSECWEGS